jgi:hypothetical protein
MPVLLRVLLIKPNRGHHLLQVIVIDSDDEAPAAQAGQGSSTASHHNRDLVQVSRA